MTRPRVTREERGPGSRGAGTRRSWIGLPAILALAASACHVCLSPAGAFAAAVPGESTRAGHPAAEALSATPSSTRAYFACPPPSPGSASCQSVIVPPAVALATVSPSSTLPTSGGIDGSGLTPAELQSAYKLPSASAGTGQTVAVVDAYGDPTAESDLATYRSDYGLEACTTANGCFSKVSQTGGTNYPPLANYSENGDWELETALDLDMVSAGCPKCHILLVEAKSSTFSNLTAAESEAVTLGATEISNSWAGGEESTETSRDPTFDHPGIPITAASGDWGYDRHEPPVDGDSPSYPAASPFVIAVGGTTLTPAANTRGWEESVWAKSGSGCSLYETKPSFQTDAGCSRRTTNDVAAVAEDLSVYNTTNATGSPELPAWITVGGTSASTPLIAAVEALSSAAARSLAAADFYESPASLFDVTSGSDGSCGGSYLCTAGPGYDGPTGVGTPDGAFYTPLTITTASLSAGVIGTQYSQTLEAGGGQPPYAWVISGGSVPAGLELSSPGVIAGTPTAAGTSSFTVRVTDMAGTTATAKLSIAVTSALRAGHPELFTNDEKIGGEAQPMATILSGNLELRSASIPEGELECASIWLGSGWNAGTPLRARGMVLAWEAGGHVPSAAHGELGRECRAGGGSSFMTSELPLEPVSAAETRRAARTLPWTFEASCGQREGEVVSIVKIGIPATAGEPAASCRSEATEDASAQSEVANGEGCYASDPAPQGCVGLTVIAPSLGLELEYGGTLRAKVINGAGNGLDQSQWVVQGAAGGELRCEAPAGCQAATVLGELKVQGFEAVQLIQLK